MGQIRFLAVAFALCVAGCATPPASAGLVVPAPDEQAAASLLGGYLLALGWTVHLAEGARVEARREDEAITLEPLLDAGGLDRVIVSRHWPRGAEADEAALRALALELNEVLNVGQFRVTPSGLSLQSSLAFLDALDPRLLDAFLEYSAEVRFAVGQVEGERNLLAPVEGASGSR
jgi:hypothetical protein